MVQEVSPAQHVANPTIEILTLNTIRCLGADLVQEHKGGHPGTVMGAAGIAVALFRHSMRFNPKNPDWFNRDRFILSAGHACLLQYILLHLSGYDAWSLDALKSYHNPNYGIAAGHPEIEFPGIEATTGPLGQGIANAVGLAIASKNLAATYNREGFPVVDNKIWCFTGDGCLQEGVGQEALSLAGHLGLGNLIVVYDDNNVTVDGTIANCFTDDTSLKMRANGFEVIDIDNGTTDLQAIILALNQAKSSTSNKPYFIHVRTTIGYGSHKANTGPAHGQALGIDEVAYVKTQFGFNPGDKFVIPQQVYEYFQPLIALGASQESVWNDLFKAYSVSYPDLHFELLQRLTGDLPNGWESLLPSKDQLPREPQPTRKSSGIVVTTLAPKYKNFVAGSADLLESTFVSWQGMVEFQNPDTGLGSYEGRQIRYGIREFAMVAIANGMTAYQNGMFIPICSTFFQFWLYAAPALRMTSLQHLRIIGIATHDSIGIGEDGPTHQPIALASFYRALPNTRLVRAADAEEVLGAWIHALSPESKHTPTIFALSRQPVPLLEGTNREKVKLGAYVVYETSSQDTDNNPDLVLIATGSEVHRAVEAAKKLSSDEMSVRVVSMPCQALFDVQPKEYRLGILGQRVSTSASASAAGVASKVRTTKRSLVIAIEAWSSYGWARYAHASLSVHTFGISAPQERLFEIFGFGVGNIVEKVREWVQSKRVGENGEVEVPGVGEFEELLIGQVGESVRPRVGVDA